MFRIINDGTIQFSIYVKTNSLKNEIIVEKEIITIKVKAAPLKGKANMAIIKILSNKIKINSSS